MTSSAWKGRSQSSRAARGCSAGDDSAAARPAGPGDHRQDVVRYHLRRRDHGDRHPAGDGLGPARRAAQRRGDTPATSSGQRTRYAQTMAFTTLVFFQLFNVFNARFDDRSAFHKLGRNWFLWLAVLISAALQAAVIY